jgi:hypothetical protein
MVHSRLIGNVVNAIVQRGHVQIAGNLVLTDRAHDLLTGEIFCYQ